MKSQDILALEKELSFVSFDAEDAFSIAQMLINKVKEEHLKNVRMRIVFDHDIVFQYLMNGKTGDVWLNRKQNTVERYHHSSYYIYLKNEEEHLYEDVMDDETIAICGGGFPLIVNNEIRGCFIVSGLEHQEDHQLIVDVLRAYKNASYRK